MIINKKQSVNFTYALFLFGLAVFPSSSFAASVYFTSNSQNIYPGDIFVVEAKISSPNELINVADSARKRMSPSNAQKIQIKYFP